MSAGESAEKYLADPASADIEGASNVLVVAPSLADGVRKAYFETLLGVDPAEQDLLTVQYNRSPRQYLAEWERYRGTVPQRCGIVDVAEPGATAGDPGVEAATVARIESPGDLTGVGMKVGSYLEDHGDAATVLTLDSVTGLLQYVDVERAFRLLHAIASQVRAVDADGYYHVDPNAHDDQVLATLAQLFDAVARFDDGDWETKRR